MKHTNASRSTKLFTPLLSSASVQAATMVLRPGQSSSDEPEEEHPKAEQWLFIVKGIGRAKARGRSISLKAGSLLLIEKNERHQLINTGRVPLVTVNFYSPPAYSPEGEVKQSVSKKRSKR